MSGVDAAATLSLKIDTSSANESLTTLENRMKGLGASLNSGSAAQPKAISSIGTSASEASAQLKTLQSTISGTKFDLPKFTVGQGDLLGGVKEKLAQEIKQLKAQFDASTREFKAQIATLSALSYSNTVPITSPKQIMLNSALMAGRMPGSLAAQEQVSRWKDEEATAKMELAEAKKALARRAEVQAAWDARKAKRSLASASSIASQWKDEEATAKMELAEFKRVKATLDYVNQTILAGAIAEKTRREEVQAAWDARKAKRSLASASSIADQWKDEEATAKMELAEAKKITAIKEALDLETAKWLRLDAKERAAATVRAARVLYGGGSVSSLSGAEASPQAFAAAQSAGSVAAAEAELAKLTNAHKTLSPAIKQSADHQLHWNKIANEGHAAVRGLSGSLGTLWITYGSLVPLLAGAALGSAFVQAAKAGSEFAYQLTFVKALSQETSGAVDMLGRSTLSLAKSSLQGPNDIASGYRILAQAGLDVTSSIAAMPHVLHLATVGEMEMEQSAVTLVGVMNAFGLSIANVEHVGDVFAKAAALSQTSVQSMTQAMKTASVVGEQYGASLEDTATAITLLAKVNITGTSAGTAYRNMLKELYSPVPAAAEAFKRLGIQTQDMAGNMRPFADVVFDLKDKLESFNKGDQVKILQRLFGERGAKEAIAMMALTKDKWIELRDAINNSEGFMSGVAKELEDTAKGRWAQAINTMKSSLISAFSEMEPAFKSLADSFKNLFSDESFTNSLKQIVSGMLTLTKAAIDLAPTLITLAEAYVVLKTAMVGAALWTAASTAISGYTAALLAASGAMGPVIKGTTVASTVLSALPAGFAALMNPMGLVVGGLAAAGLAFYLFRDRTAEAMEASADKIRNFAREAKVMLDEVARTIHTSSVAMSQSRLAAVQTALVASNDTLDDSAKQYIKQYVGKNKVSGVNAAVEAAATYVREATTTNSTGEIYTKEDAQYKAARALVDMAKTTREQQSKFYAVQADVEHKAIGEANQAALDAANKPSVTKRSGDEILGKAGKSGGSKVRDYTGDLEKSNIASLVERQQEDIKVLELTHKNHLISEDQYQSQLAGIYSTWGPKIEDEYSSSIARLAKLQAASTGDQAAQYEKKRTDMETAYRKFQFDEAYRSADSLMAEKGRIKKTADELDKIIAEQAANTKEMLDNLEASRLKLDMTPVEAAGYDAGRAARKTTNKPIADLQSQLGSAKEAGYAEDSALIKSLVAEIEKAIDAQNRLGDSAAEVAKKEAEFAREYATGWKSAYKEWEDNATNAAKMASDSFVIATNAMESALDTFLTTGKINFADFAKSVILGIAKIEARALLAQQTQGMGGFSGIVGSILKLVGMGGSSGVSGGTVAGVMVNGIAGGPMSGAGLHAGGIAGLESTFLRTVPASTFLGAPKFHQGGIASNEVPAILQRGEGVFTAKQMRALGSGKSANSSPINITVHVNGNSNAPDVRRAAGQGAREALAAFNGARRYA